ncbi:MAG: GNAT family N-acetyltransferase [Acidimicrobiia bacterium]|nr:GNAT family N-acetyltransferase [Acidimicrobiia bacterium]
MELTIRSAMAGDEATIAAYNVAMALETEAMQLEAGRTRQGVLTLLREPDRGFYLVAEADGKLIGQLMITYEWSDWRNGNFWWIQSVYVEPGHRGKGVYQRLHERVVEMAQQQDGVCGIRLYVEQHNGRAQRVYEKMGMTKTAYLVYETDFVLQR